MIRKLLLITLLLTPLFSLAQKPKEKSVRDSFTYNLPSEYTAIQAKAEAIDRAKKEIIANEFGTLIQQHNTTIVENTNGKSSIHTDMRGTSDSYGEWIETYGEPDIDLRFDQNHNMWVVNITISGKIREITNQHADFDVRILKNEPDLRFESLDFIDGDQIYLHFKAKTDGFLAVFFDDNSGTVTLLSPYANKCETTAIKGRESYIFYNSKSNYYTNDGNNAYTMSCSSDIIEYNKIHVIFSSNNFILPDGDYIGDGAQMFITDSTTFRLWLTKVLGRDKQHMMHKEIDITIKPHR